MADVLGNFHREGITDAVDPTIVNDHDFASSSDGKVIPHGIYDVAKNEASLQRSVSVSDLGLLTVSRKGIVNTDLGILRVSRIAPSRVTSDY